MGRGPRAALTIHVVGPNWGGLGWGGLAGEGGGLDAGGSSGKGVSEVREVGSCMSPRGAAGGDVGWSILMRLTLCGGIARKREFTVL